MMYVFETFGSLSVNAADDKQAIFYLYFIENRIQYFMQTVSLISLESGIKLKEWGVFTQYVER